MLPTPVKYFLSAAKAEGAGPLNAFDNALLEAGVGNINLLRVTSILPPGAEYDPGLKMPPGSLVPTAYGYIISENPGELIAAAVGIGFSEDTFGVIMEYSGKCSRETAEGKIKQMLMDAFEYRKMELKSIKIAAAEHKVVQTGCVLAAVPLWY